MCLLWSCTTVLGKAWLWRLGGAGRGCGSPRSHHLARAKALVAFLRQKPGQVREKTGPGGPAFLVPLPLVCSSPRFLDSHRFRFLTTLLGSTRTPASNTDLSVTQWPTAPSAPSSSPSSPSSLVRGRRRGEGARFPFLPFLLARRGLHALSGTRLLSPVSRSLLDSLTVGCPLTVPREAEA